MRIRRDRQRNAAYGRPLPPGRGLLGVALAAIVALGLVACGDSDDGGGGASAPESFPDETITVLVGTPPGSVNDTSARTIAPLLEDELGTSMVVRNVEGGGGVAAVQQLLDAPADGYTLLTASPTLLTLPSEPGVDFTIAEDIQPVAIVGVVPFIIVVPADSEFQTLDDLVTYAEDNPGELNFGGVFPIGNHRMHWELFEDAAGIDATYVPFDGGAELDAALAGGKIAAGTSVSPRNIQQLTESGKVRALAVSTEERIDALPDVPTYSELGIDYVRDGWDGVVTKRGVPDSVVRTLSEAYQAAIEKPEWQEYLDQQAATRNASGPAELTEKLNREAEQADEIIADIEGSS